MKVAILDLISPSYFPLIAAVEMGFLPGAELQLLYPVTKTYEDLHDGKLDFDEWCEGIRRGRNYVSDGRSHLLEFKVNSAALGENGSELRLEAPGTVRVTARAAALLDSTPDTAMKKRPYDQKPYWHIERARIGETGEVPVEVLVNGLPVARKHLAGDGELRDIAFDVKVERSSWIALRILPSSHTNPIWVLVNDKPVRASRKSAEWCLQAVDRCYQQKVNRIRLEERDCLRELRALVVLADPAEAERRRRLTSAAELHLPQLRVPVADELEERVRVAMVVPRRRLGAPRAADRLEALSKRVAERDVVGRLAGRGRTRHGEQRSGKHDEYEREDDLILDDWR